MEKVILEGQIKDCPHCGPVSRNIAVVEGEGIVWVECLNCRSKSGHHDDKFLAIDTWNDRYSLWYEISSNKPKEFNQAEHGLQPRTLWVIDPKDSNVKLAFFVAGDFYCNEFQCGAFVTSIIPNVLFWQYVEAPK